MQRQAAREAAPGPAAVGGDSKQQEEEESAVREHVYQRVLASNVLPSVKAHLRAAIFTLLKNQGSEAPAGACWPASCRHSRAPTLQQHLLNCLLAEHLLASQHRYTLSVFMAESGSGALPRLDRADLLRLIGVLPTSQVHALLMRGDASGSSTGGGCEEACGGCPASPPAPVSMAEAMLFALGRLGGGVSTAAAACQTDACGGEGGAPGPLRSQHLLQRLHQVEEEYRIRSGAAEEKAAMALEERMAAFQKEVEARCAEQLREQLAAVREGELAEARRSEAARCQQQLEAERAALQAAHRRRLEEVQRREEEVAEWRRQAAKEQCAAVEEQLRRVRSEQDKLAAWKAEREARLAAAEAAAGLAQGRAEEAARRAVVLQREGQARLAEAEAREAEAARRQARADAELERGAAVQRQLDATREELGGAQRQARAAQAAHQAALADARLEVESLRRQNQQLREREAAAAGGPGLAPRDAARLQQALRRLVERVEELQAEAAAGREREKLWRSAAGDADRALRQSAAALERALRHGEELRLALGSAASEAADLAQRACTAAAGLEGPLAAALRDACQDVQRWSESASGRVEAAKRAEGSLRREAAACLQRAQGQRAALARGLRHALHRQGAGGCGGEASGRDESSGSEGWPAPGLAGPARMPRRRPAGGEPGSQQPARGQGRTEQGHPPGCTAIEALAARRARQQQAAQAGLPWQGSEGSLGCGQPGSASDQEGAEGGTRDAAVPSVGSRPASSAASEGSSGR